MGDVIDILIALGGGALAVVMAYLFGRREGKRTEQVKQRADKLKRDTLTKERIADALEDDDDARSRGDSWVDRLRRAGQ